MKTFGLTGNMGCGKSTVAKLLAEYPDVTVIDCDTLAREELASTKNREAIEIAIGLGAFVGMMPDLRFISNEIFSNKDKKEKIEQIIYPHVLEKIRMAQEKQGNGILVVESAILFEKEMEKYFNGIIVASCNYEEQVRRLKECQNVAHEEIMRRLACQLSQEEKEKRAQYLIRTECDIETLRERVKELYNQLTQEVLYEN